MKAEDLSLFLTAYSLTVAFAAIAEFLFRRRAWSAVHAAIALAAVASTVVMTYYLKPDRSYLARLWTLIQHRDTSALLALLLGFAAALVWTARYIEIHTAKDGPQSPGNAPRLWVGVLLLASVVGVVAGGQVFLWKELAGYQRDPLTRMDAPEFEIEKVADLNYFPIRVASSDDNRIYVSCDYFEEWGDMGGVIVQLVPDDASAGYVQRIVVDSPLLLRPYGLAARGDALYISRSGIRGRADSGKVSYDASGAVTELKDLDDDGYFEFAHDIVTDLPGVRGPDTMQQNNGIAFASDGSLFVTSAVATNRSLDEHPWGGTLLRVSPDFAEIEVFAKGFRNPFGITIGPDDAIFVTDNDIDENPGDELNHVLRDEHYGHPFVVADRGAENCGFRAPILVSDAESNYQGLVFATSPLLPDKYRNCIYLTDFMGDKILRLTLERPGDTFRITGVHPFASVSTPVDITVTPSGEFFIVSRQQKQILRIRPKCSTRPMTTSTLRQSSLRLATAMLVPMAVWWATAAMMSGPRAARGLDLAAGQETFHDRCARCHFAIKGFPGHHGPNLHRIGSTAATRRAGLSAVQYIWESILEPAAFVSPDSRPGMPRNTIAGLSPDEIRNLIAYVASRGAIPEYGEILRLDIPEFSLVEQEGAEITVSQMAQAEFILRDKAHCLDCHSVYNHPEYKVYAPGLFGVGLVDAESIRESIVSPHKVVSPVFQCVQVLLISGQVVCGRLLAQTDKELSLLTVDAKQRLERRVIPLEEVETQDGVPLIQASPLSLMPSGFMELLNTEELNAVESLIRHLND